MSVPYIEYHFNTFESGSWWPTWELHKVGTTFAQVQANGWTWLDKFVPLRLRWPSYAWPGGYPIFFVTGDNGVLCPNCANEHLDLTLDKDDLQWHVVAMDVNHEDQHLYCDHCNTHLEPACGFDTTEEKQDA